MNRKKIYALAGLLLIAVAGIVIGQLIIERILQANVTINARVIQMYAEYQGVVPLTSIDFGAPFYADQVTSDPATQTMYLHDLDQSSAQYSILCNTTGVPEGVSFSCTAYKSDGQWTESALISNGIPIQLGYIPGDDQWRWAKCVITLSLNGQPATAGAYTFSINFWATKT